VLLNMFEDTLDTLTSKPFADEVVYGEDVPAAIVEQVLDDVDMQGSNLHAFSKSWFRQAFAKGLSHVLVDQPQKLPTVGADGAPRERTLEDDRKEGIRPYWVHIRPENLLAAYGTTVNGKEVLTHIRIREATVERRGFEEVHVERIRVLEPGRWELWELDSDGKKWQKVDGGDTGLPAIPLVTFYAGEREGLMLCKPPLTDLAHLNIAHWQSSADQRNVLTVARFPILAGKGIDEDAKVEIGPNNYLTSTEGGEWYYVEHTGAAIEAGRKDLEALENQMASYGAEFLRQKPGGETATARALDSAENTSYLGDAVRRFEDSIAQALQFTADWMNLDQGGHVALTEIDEEPAGTEAPTLDTLTKARAARDLSRENYLLELKRRGVLCEDFDVEQNNEQLDHEAPTDGLGGMFGGGNGPGMPGDPAAVQQPGGVD
jgi:hypothetical protein